MKDFNSKRQQYYTRLTVHIYFILDFVSYCLRRFIKHFYSKIPLDCYLKQQTLIYRLSPRKQFAFTQWKLEQNIILCSTLKIKNKNKLEQRKEKHINAAKNAIRLLCAIKKQLFTKKKQSAVVGKRSPSF